MLHLRHVHFTEDSVTLDMGILVLELLVLELLVLELLVLELPVLELLALEPRITINERETALVGAVFFYKRIIAKKENS
ncbi:hypothetical protein [Neobacillus sp. OS1-33]|uniref:hypothetical protein n=1 Tax=Neobacillus sp. OS1-33 TaxID=3070683 RepID=UPI0027E03FDB|nr:hypothetical protein [Neobacillus sp. OS1-33]WML28580.1 hypothetical protein RCG22_19820 [Neobacillus sp. OS1-33]